jgi:hypothetical protein
VGLSGTVAEANDNQVKVKWDNGRTSYYRRNAPAKIDLERAPKPEKAGLCQVDRSRAIVERQ